MPFTVQDLIEDRPKPVTVNRDDSTHTALQLMIAGNFSQLPVVDSERKAKGMITSDSIIRALSHFDLTIKEMRVFHAMDNAIKYRPDDDLFDLLDDLKDAYAVAVIDNDDRIVGIVTNYDTSEYFRRRGEDMMLVEDIETMVKEYTKAAFLDESGEIDRPRLDAAVEEITSSNGKLRGPFRQALHCYLQLSGESKPNLNSLHVDNAFGQYLNPKQSPKQFEQLTFNDYMELFLNKSRWERYKSVFDLDPNSCRKLLEAVRNTRNELAHFRADLTPQKREQLRFCKEWLARHQSEITETFAPVPGETTSSTEIAFNLDEYPNSGGLGHLGKIIVDAMKAIRLGKYGGDELPVQLAESPDSRESRYAPLALFLQSQPMDQERMEMRFDEIELLIGGVLPKYARQHRSWWANDTSGHVQSQQWLDAGWRVSSVNMSEERVTFSRMREREQAYITFFGSLLSGLRERNAVPVRAVSASGHSWISLVGLAPERERQASFVGCSFARRRIFRVELYIDQGAQTVNKGIFDNLHSGYKEIEAEVGESLSWERLNERQASRIALHHPGSITDRKEELAQLRDWAIDGVIKFYNVFKGRIEQSPITVETDQVPTDAQH